MSNINLIIYSLAWWILLIRLRKKVPSQSISIFTVTLYLIWSLCSILLYNCGWYDYLFPNPITLFPFIYLFIIVYIVIRPAIQFDKAKVAFIQKPSNFILYSFFLVYGISSILTIPELIENFSTDLIRIIMNPDAGAEIYDNKKFITSSSTLGLSGIWGLFSAIHNIFRDISVFFLFYYLTLKRQNKWLVFFLLLLLIIDMLSCITKGGRTGIVMTTLTLLVAYFMFSKFLNPFYKKNIKKIIVILAIFVSVPFMALTISRFSRGGEEYGGTIGGILNYSGQASLMFNQYVLDAGGTREGSRTMCLFKKMLGYKVPMNFEEGRDLYSSTMTIDDSNFSTFVGDFVLDFGPVRTFMLFFVFSLIFVRLTKPIGNTIPIHRFFLLYFITSVCVQGSMYLYNYSYTNNLIVIAFICMYLILVVDFCAQKGRFHYVSV